MATPEDEFKKHFEARAAAARIKQSELDATYQEREKLRVAVVEKMDKAIRPAMERLRDLLLDQNCPAEVEFLPKLENADAYAVIALHCSNNIADYGKPATALKFFAGYALQATRLVYRTNCQEGKPVPTGRTSNDVPVALSDLTQEDANRRLMAFIKTAFPA